VLHAQQLLDLLTGRAAELGVEHSAVQGDWPEDAARVGPAEVVVCHHVAYNIPRLDAFATELSAHARVRVVMELSGRHPRFGLNFLWRHFWDVDRPTGPTADEAIAVLAEVDIEPAVERIPRVGRGMDPAVRVASARKYLCLPAERDPEIAALLDAELMPPGETVTLWWDGTAGH